jgi:hypothetical protein
MLPTFESLQDICISSDVSACQTPTKGAIATASCRGGQGTIMFCSFILETYGHASAEMMDVAMLVE